MKLTVIGTSCTWFDRKNTSFLIDENIVFDVPTGSYKDIMRLTTIKKISHVLITHFHGDHFGDLYIMLTRFARELKDLKTKVKVFAPKGCLERIIKLNEAMSASKPECDPETYLKNIEFIDVFDGAQFDVGKYKVKAYKMSHGIAETYGYLFVQPDGTAVGFSSDTTICDNLEKLLASSNYALVEMASTNGHPGHISIAQFEELVKKYNDCKLYPVHTCDECQAYAKLGGLNVLEDGQILKF